MNKLGKLLTEVDFGDPIGVFNVEKELNDPEWGEMKDIEIITLKQYLREKAFKIAWRFTEDPYEAERNMETLLRTTHIHAKEFVCISPDKITIGVNADKVNTGAIRHAFELLSEIIDLQKSTFREFGDFIKVNET